MNLVSDVEMQYYEVLKILIDPELEPLKSRITVITDPIAVALHEFDRTSRIRVKPDTQMQDE